MCAVRRCYYGQFRQTVAHDFCFGFGFGFSRYAPRVDVADNFGKPSPQNCFGLRLSIGFGIPDTGARHVDVANNFGKAWPKHFFGLGFPLALAVQYRYAPHVTVADNFGETCPKICLALAFRWLWLSRCAPRVDARAQFRQNLVPKTFFGLLAFQIRTKLRI